MHFSGGKCPLPRRGVEHNGTGIIDVYDGATDDASWMIELDDLSDRRTARAVPLQQCGSVSLDGGENRIEMTKQRIGQRVAINARRTRLVILRGCGEFSEINGSLDDICWRRALPGFTEVEVDTRADHNGQRSVWHDSGFGQDAGKLANSTARGIDRDHIVRPGQVKLHAIQLVDRIDHGESGRERHERSDTRIDVHKSRHQQR